MDWLKKIPQAWKFIVALLTPVFLVIQGAVTDGEITTQEWIAIGASIVVAVGVFLKRNQPKPEPLPPPPPAG